MKRVQVAMGVCVGVALLAGALLAAKPAAPAKGRPPVLPSWAPKRPSSEFLRAAKVLRPIPAEVHGAAYSPLYVPAWELFGSLNDKQIKQFLTPKQVSQPIADTEPGEQKYLREKEQAKQVGDKLVYYSQFVYVGVKALSPRQHALFDTLVRAWPEANLKGTQGEDLLVILYKMGAKKDLSNASVGFSLSGRHAVNLNIMVATPLSGGRRAGSGVAVWIAQL